jgi:site-specific recombinase XerD
LTSPDAQRGYRLAIDEFVDWYCSEPRLAFNRIVVLRYRSHLESRQLAPGTINLRLGAVRRLAYEAADCGLLSADLAAGIRRVKGVKKLGVRPGNWLTAEQSQRLWQAPDEQRLNGKRDRALLALLLACGLRRHEAVALTFDHLQQREDHWAIVDLVGKALLSGLNQYARPAIRRQERAWNIVRTMKAGERMCHACSNKSADAADHNR